MSFLCNLKQNLGCWKDAIDILNEYYYEFQEVDDLGLYKTILKLEDRFHQ